MPHSWRLALLLALASTLLAEGAPARVLRVEIERRTPVVGGRPFGERGAYELIEGRVHFGFEPDSDANARVADLALAERGDDGLVHADAGLVVLQPADPARRRGTALVEVVNRGRRLLLGSLDRAGLDFHDATLDPARAADFGDGFLLEQGLTIVWVGWQHDAPRVPGSLWLRVPRARSPEGGPLRGLARSDWIVEEATDRLPLAALGHEPHVAAEPEAPENVLTVRDTREGERRVVPREAWRFDDDGTAIVAEAGFTPGHVYELVYVAHDPPLVGLGFTAIRDIAAYLRHDEGCAFPAGRAVAIGSSQSGRFLRHFLYEGFNLDEAGRRVFDGVVIQIAGAGRGGFNHRFSHPGRVGNPFRNFFYPGDDFPFASRATTDPLSGRKAGLLDRLSGGPGMPRIFQINGGYEYWGRAASLIHTTPDGREDVAPHDAERLYHVASAPHYPLPFPPTPQSEIAPGIFRGSSLESSSISRALLLHMLAWVEEGREPPPSRVPRIDAGQLVEPGAMRNPVPGLATPRSPHVADRLDFGPRFERGIVDRQPPTRGGRYGVRIPQLDALGSEAAGIRGVALRAPIGSYLPWALRAGHPFASDEMADYLGSFAPFARDASERAERGDPRPSLAELHPSRADYEKRVEEGIEALVAEGFLLERDRAYERAEAMRRWDWITTQRD